MIHYMTVQGVGDAWIANELRVVCAKGIPVELHALRHPANTYFKSDDITALAKRTRAIYPVSKARVATALLAAPFRFGTRFWGALGSALFGPRESLRVRAVGLWHLGVACHWAQNMRSETVSLIHSQWIHSAGTVAMYGARLLDVPFSFTGHAADLFRERCALKAKIAAAEFIVCISEFHRQFYISEGADPDKLFIVYCGLDLTHFTPLLRDRPKDAPVRILSSGRLVPKKGFDVLIRALGLLRDRGLDFEAVIAGSGPEEATLRAQITAAGLDDRITLTGEILKQEDIPAFMEQGDLYTLPCQWAPDRDVDGLPQMLMEAMACGLPSVSTELVGIPDLVIHEKTGLLIAPEDPEALADALARLEADPQWAKELAQAGRAHILDQFDLQTCLEPLLSRYRKKLEKTS